MIKQLKQEGFKPVIYVSNSLLRTISAESREKLNATLKETGLKIYSEATESYLLAIKKPYIFKYGYLRDAIANRVSSNGGKIVGGNF